jgi:periplasmic protein CpxP/Spy
MMKLSSRAALFAGVALMALPGLAMAQSTATPPSASAPSMAPPSAPPAAPSAAPAQPGAQPSANAAAEQRVEARIKQLHGQLKITAAEETQWNQFAQTMRDNAREMDEEGEQRAEQFSTMTAVDDLQSYEKLAEAHVQHLQKLIPAFQALYDAMSPDQKKTADQVFRAGAEAHAAQKASSQ